MFQRQPLTIAILATTLGLVACNSNDHDTVNSTSTPTTMTTITVTPSLGKILSGRVVLRDAQGVDLAPPKTLTPADNGTASFMVPVAKLAEPVIAAVLPTVAGQLEYADEALEKATTITVPVADASKPLLRAAASVTANANIGVTALTESAVKQAENAVGGLIAQNINQANAAVKNALNLNFNITQAPIVVGVGEFDQLANAALDAQRRAYAAYLATLAKEAQRMNAASLAPAYDMAKVLANDFSDGTFDAKQGTTALTFYNTTFVNAWINWVQNFYSSFTQLANIVALNRWYGGFNIADKSSVTNFPDATPIRTVDGVEEYACSGEGRIKSSTGASIYMDFVNQRGSNVNVYWLDYNTGRVSYKPNLATGQTHNQQTFVTHPWLITDNSGACLGIYRPVTATNKVLTFKADSVAIGTNAPQPTATACTTGVEATFATTANNSPYTNGQKVCFNASTTSLAFDNKTLTNPVKNTVVQAPYSAYTFKDGSYSYEMVFKDSAFYELNLSLSDFIGQFTPVATTPAVETCASKKLPQTTLASISDYSGDYFEQGAVVFNLNTSTAKANVKGTEANVSEVCGPNTQGNGTNHVLITDKGNVTLFKTTAGVYSAEGFEFSNKNKVFYGEKATPSPTTACVGNTNPFGCLTITGTNAPASIYEYQGSGAPLFQSAVANTGAITYSAKALGNGNLIVNGMAVGFQQIAGNTQNSTYTFFQYDSSFNVLKSINMKCRDANNSCAGLTVDNINKTVTYNNVVMTDVNGTGATLTFNGILKY